MTLEQAKTDLEAHQRLLQLLRLKIEATKSTIQKELKAGGYTCVETRITPFLKATLALDETLLEIEEEKTSRYVDDYNQHLNFERLKSKAEVIKFKAIDGEPTNMSRVMCALACDEPLPEDLTPYEECFLKGVEWQKERPWMIPGVTFVDPNYREITPADLEILGDIDDGPNVDDEAEDNE